MIPLIFVIRMKRYPAFAQNPAHKKDKNPDPDGTLSGDRRGKGEALVHLIFVIRLKSFPAFAQNPALER